jgi:hypothetical protein
MFQLSGGEVLIALGVVAAMLVIGLALRPHPSGIAGTISMYLCSSNSSNAAPCSIHPVQANVRIEDCHRESGGGTDQSRVSPNMTTIGIWRTNADAEGHYHLDLAPGVYCVFAWSGYGSADKLSVAVQAGHVSKIDLTLAESGMPICLAAQDTIAGPSGSVLVSQLRAGMLVWTLNAAGKRIVAPVMFVRHTRAPMGHVMVRLVLADGRLVEASPGHPTSDGRRIGDLRLADKLDGSRVVRVEILPYVGDTWDVLPAGSTGVYWADGVLLESTLIPAPVR